MTTNILQKIKAVLEKEMPDIVLVHGDTSTTFTTALACFFLHIRVGHVEAGLRTHNLQSPFPEEFNRKAVGVLSALDFCPTQVSKKNLLKEGKPSKCVFVTGNTAIDALRTTVREDYTNPVIEWGAGSRILLFTAHRRENLGEPLYNMFRALRRIVEEFPDVKVVYPIHPNPNVRRVAEDVLQGVDRIRLVEPLDVVGFHNLIARSYLVLSDSGGIQEEAPSLGTPVLVMRDTTERPEAVEAGTVKLVGTSESTIYRETKNLLTNKEEYDKMSHTANPYGDGFASIRIADILERYEDDSVYEELYELYFSRIYSQG